MRWMICGAAALLLGPWNAHAPGGHASGGPTAARPGSRTIAPIELRAPGPAAFRATGIERCTPDQKPLLLDPTNPEWHRRAPAVYRARFETSKGVFVVEAVRAYAPIGVDRFYNLVRLCYYDDTRFHRVAGGYIAQFGLHGDPAVNRAWLHRQIRDDPPHGSNVRGTLAFAMTPEPDTRNTQVYINLGDNTRNDREPFAIFGRVVEGMDVLDRLYAGYGERSGSGLRQGRQGATIEGGNTYLDREFPLLDRIIRATIVDVPAQ